MRRVERGEHAGRLVERGQERVGLGLQPVVGLGVELGVATGLEAGQSLTGQLGVGLVDVGHLDDLDALAAAQVDHVDQLAGGLRDGVALAHGDEDRLDALLGGAEDLLGDPTDRPDGAVGVDGAGHGDVGVERLTAEQGEHGDGLERTGARPVDGAADLELVAALERRARQQRGHGDRAPGGGAALVAEAADLVLAEVDPQRTVGRGAEPYDLGADAAFVATGEEGTDGHLRGLGRDGRGGGGGRANRRAGARRRGGGGCRGRVGRDVVVTAATRCGDQGEREDPSCRPTDALVHDHLSWFLLRSAPRRRRAGRLAATRHDGPEDSGSAAASLWPGGPLRGRLQQTGWVLRPT